jgi:hypothetical protein
MKQLIALLLLFSSSLFAAIGEISAINGDAILLRDGKTLPLKLHTTIEQKDTIKTSKGTKLQIVFKDNTIISLGQKSTFKVESYLFSKKSVNAHFNVKGLFKSITGKIGHIAPKNFKLKTQNATIGVRGTTIIGESTPNADTIICSSGQIVVTTNKGSMVVNMGEKTIIHPHRKPSKPIILAKESIKKVEREITIEKVESSTLLPTPDKESKLIKEVENIKEITQIKEEKEDWGVWDKVDAVETDLLKEVPTPSTPIVQEKDVEELAHLREKAGTKVAKYHGQVAGFVDTPHKKISDGSIDLNVDLGRGNVDGEIGFSQGDDRWQASIKDGSVDKNGVLDFGISNDNNLQGSGDGMLSGEHLEHANGTFKIKNETNNQHAYGTFKAGR